MLCCPCKLVFIGLAAPSLLSALVARGASRGLSATGLALSSWASWAVAMPSPVRFPEPEQPTSPTITLIHELKTFEHNCDTQQVQVGRSGLGASLLVLSDFCAAHTVLQVHTVSLLWALQGEATDVQETE